MQWRMGSLAIHKHFSITVEANFCFGRGGIFPQKCLERDWKCGLFYLAVVHSEPGFGFEVVCGAPFGTLNEGA
jgi:hypothetical protein